MNTIKTYANMVELFEQANRRFLDQEQSLLVSNTSERTLCGALMLHLNDLIARDESFSGYHVDVEYNRNDGEIKTILGPEMQIININCDLILHSRGEHPEQDNLIALEMKKSERPSLEKEKDKNRLIALTKDSFDDIWSNDGKTFPEHVCGYVLGIYYEINYQRHHIDVEYYRCGAKCNEFPITF